MAETLPEFMTDDDNPRQSTNPDAVADGNAPVSALTEGWIEPQGENQFCDIYREQAEALVRAGAPHLTLGANLTSAPLAAAGLSEFDSLRRYGLGDASVCVDYGCGTLRVGKHLIGFLSSEAYWGLDISAYLMDEGIRLLRPGVVDEKRPNLRVISEEAVTEAAAATPDLVCSIAVLMHVHPRELSRFARHLAMLIGARGRLVFTGRCSEQTKRHGPRSWSHGRERLDEVFSAFGVRLRELASEPSPKPGVPDGRKVWFCGER
jgi:hypothetical protein